MSGYSARCFACRLQAKGLVIALSHKSALNRAKNTITSYFVYLPIGNNKRDWHNIVKLASSELGRVILFLMQCKRSQLEAKC